MADGHRIQMPDSEANLYINVENEDKLKTITKMLDKINDDNDYKINVKINTNINKQTIKDFELLSKSIAGFGRSKKNLDELKKSLNSFHLPKLSEGKVELFERLSEAFVNLSKGTNLKKIQDLSDVDFSKLNNIGIDQTTLSNLSSVFNGVKGVFDSFSSITQQVNRDNSEEAKKENARYKELSKTVKSYYDLKTKAVKAGVTSEYDKKGITTYKSDSNPELARRLTEAEKALKDAKKETILTAEHSAEIKKLETDRQNKLNIAEEEHRNKLAKEADKLQEVSNSENTRFAALKSIESALKSAEVAQEKYNAASKSDKESAESYAAFGGYITELKELQTEINKTGEVSEKQRDRIKALTDLIATSKLNIERNKSNTFTLNPDTSPNQYAKAMADVTSSLNKATQAQKNFTAAKNGKSSESYNKLDGYINNLIKLKSELETGKKTEKEFRDELNTINSGLKISTAEIERNGEAHKTLSGQIKDVVTTFKSWFSMSSIVMALFRELRQGINTSIELNKAFMQLQIVTGATNTEMREFTTTAYELSKAVGQSVVDVTKSIETFSRLGYNLQDASSLAKYATILSNVAAVDTGSATTGLTSIIKGFNLDITKAEHVADVLVDVGQKYAVSAGEIMEAFEKSGAALSATGVGFDEAAGLIAAANASVQNASTVGTALKTISARIRGSKSELQELGEDTEDIADGFSKYAKEVKALSGVDIMLEGSTNQFKNLYQIMSEIAVVWEGLTGTQQSRISEIFGGTRQLQVISSMIGNWKDAVGATNTARESANVAMQANIKYMDTAAAHIEQFKSSLQELYATIFTEDVTKFFVDFAGVLVDILKFIASAANGLGGLKTVLVAIAGIITTIKIDSIIDTLNGKFATLKESLSAVKKGFSETASSAKSTASAFSVLVTACIAYYSALENIRQDAIVENEKIINNNKEALESFDEFSKSVSVYKEYSEILNRTEAEEESYKDSISSITEMINKRTDALNDLTEGTKEYTEALKDQMIEEAKEAARIASEAKTAAGDNLKSKSKGLIGGATGSTEFGVTFGIVNKEEDMFGRPLYSLKDDYLNDLWKMAPDANYRIVGGSSITGGALLGSTNFADYNDINSYIKLYDYYIKIRDKIFEDGNSDKYSELYKRINGVISLMKDDVESYIESTVKAEKANKILADGYPESSEALAQFNSKLYKDTADSIGISESLVKKVMGVTNTLTNTKPSDTTIAGVTVKNFKTISEEVEKSVEKIEKFDEILSKVRSGKNITDKDVETLLGSFPELSTDLIKTTDGYSISLENLTRSINKYRDSSVDIIEKRKNDVLTDEASAYEKLNALIEKRSDIEKGVIELRNRRDSTTGIEREEVTKVLNKAESEYADKVREVNKEISEQKKLIESLDGSAGIYQYYIDRLSDSDLVSLTDATATLKSNYDIIATAQKEMNTGTGLSESTIKSLSSATDKYNDFLYEEAGVIKLNIEEWKAYSDALFRTETGYDSVLNKNIELQQKRKELEDTVKIISSFKDNIYDVSKDSKVWSHTGFTSEYNSAIDDMNQLSKKTGMSIKELVDNLDNYKNELSGITDELSGNAAELGMIQASFKNITDDTVRATIEANNFVKAVSKVQTLSSGFDVLSKVYGDVYDKKEFSYDSIINNDTFASLFSSLDEYNGAYSTFIKTVAESPADINACQEAFNNLATAYVNNSLALNYVTKETKDATIAMLTDMGVANASEVVNAKLARDTEYLALAKGELADATYEEVAAEFKSKASLDDEGNAATLTSQALAQLAVDKFNINANIIDTTIEIKQLEKLANAAGATAESLKRIGDAKEYIAEADSWKAILENMEKMSYIPTSEIERVRKQMNEALEKAAKTLEDPIKYNAIEFASVDVKYTGKPSDTTDKKSSSSSKKDNDNWFKRWNNWHTHQVDIEKETDADYLEWLEWAYKQAYKEGIITLDEFYTYEKKIHDGLKSIKDDAKKSLDELVNYRIKMIKQDLEDQKTALNKRLKGLKEFYSKQKELLKDEKKEEEYLENQKEKRKAVTDIESELKRLEYDNSAWAQKKKLELQKELKKAQDELDKFEKDHAYDLATDNLEKQEKAQEKLIEKEIEEIDKKLNDPELLMNKALSDIKNNTLSLYNEMLAFNKKHGDADDETVKKMWEEAYKNGVDFNDAFATWFRDVILKNATGYKTPTPDKYTGDTEGHTYPGDTNPFASKSSGSSGSSDSKGSSGSKTTTPTSSTKPSLANGSSIKVKSTATNFGSKSGGGKMASWIPGGSYTVYGVDGDQVLIGINGQYTGWIKKSDIVGYATGTNSATAGFHRVNEMGLDEVVFSSKDGNSYRLLNNGDKVLNGKASDFLYNFATSGGRVLEGMIGKMIVSAFGKISNGAMGNQITMSPIIIQGNADMKTVSEIRRAQREALEDTLKAFNRLNK